MPADVFGTLAPCGAGTVGIVKVNTDPTPFSLSTVRSPSISHANCLAITSPTRKECVRKEG